MPVWTLSSMTWEEVDALDRGRAIAILPTGAIEAHGPHLPMDTDIVIVEAMARVGGERLASGGYDVLMLPAIHYSAAGFAADFPGTVSLRPATFTALVEDIGRNLLRHGIVSLAIANAHLDPEHLSAIDDAVERLRADGLTVAAPNLTRHRWAERLTEEFRSGACHAGQFETSIVLAERATSVRESIRRQLKPNPRSLSAAIRDGKRTFAEAGGDRAYFGFPADATAEEGRATVETLGSILEESVLAELGDA